MDRSSKNQPSNNFSFKTGPLKNKRPFLVYVYPKRQLKRSMRRRQFHFSVICMVIPEKRIFSCVKFEKFNNFFVFFPDGCNEKNPTRRELIFPLLFRNNSSVFSFKDCCFAMQKDREGSARVRKKENNLKKLKKMLFLYSLID